MNSLTLGNLFLAAKLFICVNCSTGSFDQVIGQAYIPKDHLTGNKKLVTICQFGEWAVWLVLCSAVTYVLVTGRTDRYTE